MATEDVARITYKELEDYVKKNYGDHNKDKRQKRVNRPAVQIYRAGVSRLKTKSGDSTHHNSQNGPIVTETGENWDDLGQNEEEYHEKEDKIQSKRQKRPQMALYVPKNRQAGGDAKPKMEAKNSKDGDTENNISNKDKLPALMDMKFDQSSESKCHGKTSPNNRKEVDVDESDVKNNVRQNQVDKSPSVNQLTTKSDTIVNQTKTKDKKKDADHKKDDRVRRANAGSSIGVFNPFKITVVKPNDKLPSDNNDQTKSDNSKVEVREKKQRKSNVDKIDTKLVSNSRKDKSEATDIVGSEVELDDSSVAVSQASFKSIETQGLKKITTPRTDYSPLHSYSHQRHRHRSSGSSKGSSQEDEINFTRNIEGQSSSELDTKVGQIDLNVSKDSTDSEGPVLNWAAEMEGEANGPYEYSNPKVTEGKVDDFRESIVPRSMQSPSDERHDYSYNRPNRNYRNNRNEHAIRHDRTLSSESSGSYHENTEINRHHANNTPTNYDGRQPMKGESSSPYRDFDYRKRSMENLTDGENEFPGYGQRRMPRNRHRSDRGDSDQERSLEYININMRNPGQRQILSRGNSSDELNKSHGRRSPTGLLHLPPSAPRLIQPNQPPSNTSDDKDFHSRGKPSRQLFNPNNPSRPIVVDKKDDIRDPQPKAGNDVYGHSHDSSRPQNPKDYRYPRDGHPRDNPRNNSRSQVNDRRTDDRRYTKSGTNKSPTEYNQENDRDLQYDNYEGRNDERNIDRHDDRHTMDNRLGYNTRSHERCSPFDHTKDHNSPEDKQSIDSRVDIRQPPVDRQSPSNFNHRDGGYNTMNTGNDYHEHIPQNPQQRQPNHRLIDPRPNGYEQMELRNSSPREMNRGHDHYEQMGLPRHPIARHMNPGQMDHPNPGYTPPYGHYPRPEGYPRVPMHPNMYYYMQQQGYQQFSGQNPYYNRFPPPYDYIQPQPHIMAEHMMCEAMLIESQLTPFIMRRQNTPDYFTRLDTLRYDLRSKYEQILLNDPDFSLKHNIDQQLWKSIYYQVIESTRKMIADHAQTRLYLLNVFNEGTTYYQSLLSKLQTKYNFDIEEHLTDTLVQETVSRSVKLALMSAQRTMICLGDIARYHEQLHDANNYGKARSWYMKAQQIAPKNGRPYNQLAILAVYTKRKLDAVYYYMRSLAASNPFLTARECLMGLFEETRKKAEFVEKQRMDEKERMKKLRKRRKDEGPRVEVWIHDDGSSQEDEVVESYEEDLHKLLPIDLNKRLTLSFLNVHGKLFTKIGMEAYSMVVTQLCQELQVLLTHTPPPITSERLLQLLAINMFAIDNTALKNAQDLDPNTCRSQQQEQSVQMSLDLFSLILVTSTTLLQSHVHSMDYPTQIVPAQLQLFLPSIKVWLDWMICHESLWNPMPTCAKPPDSFVIDVWETVATFFNVVKDIDISHVIFYADKQEGCEVVILPEDQAMAGFVPLLSAPNDPVYIDSSTDKELAKDCIRIQKLQLFSEYLCGVEPPMLAYDVEKKVYYSVCPSLDILETDDGPTTDSIDILEEADSWSIEVEENERGSGELSDLRRRKRELQRRVEHQARSKETREAILDEHRHKSRVVLEICPTFLIADTNCFIKHLMMIIRIVQRQKYIIVVPLVVINELDGLCLGRALGHYDPEHALSVRTNAQEAIAYLESQFDVGNKYVLALTSKGTALTTISFRSEEITDHGINDDRILECCLHYCKDTARDFMTKDHNDTIHLKRDIVLLTDDRNLRLKAHTKNVPVKDVPGFLSWSKIT